MIANRGEIALRVQRACRGLGLRTVAVYAEPDRDAPHVRLADAALCIGPAAARDSYLNQAAILFAAEISGAQAIHPGYGFLAENADFVERVEAAGLTFIGPTAAAIRLMGDKIAAKRAMRASGVPCVPGPDAGLPDAAPALHVLAEAIGYPVIVKAAGGGGGRGMRLVRAAAELEDAVAVTREEARRAFGNGEIYLEKFLEHPRHVEIQVLADHHGTALWLGSRDCSLQRRHQKVIEEAPAPGIAADRLAEIGASCVAACRRIGYRGLGTFEFLYTDGAFFFIEMNTRVQVEHTVTEMVTGLDLVQLQLRVANGEALTLRQEEIACHGHAVECRVNAEHPETFAPSPGRITAWHAPGGPGVRLDSHMGAGATIPAHYDSLIAKLIVHDTTRPAALARMRAALDEMQVGGIATNLALHRRLLREPGVIAGGFDIHHLERWLAAS
ncbi:MAG: acetyl-CoA carboxylase biotin carboxylase subunit [Rhodospirillales bacterium]|nr:acetyl-CoA carboxylase biotin carboxylase subunit [Rhodospirillales bacterium]MDE2200155.1 acetyl-CoA carboxylase biotin carboxylase subunit [Rhodospirillales bacterium]